MREGFGSPVKAAHRSHRICAQGFWLIPFRRFRTCPESRYALCRRPWQNPIPVPNQLFRYRRFYPAKLEIMNSDQGSQFTGSAWITTLTDAKIKISMDGRGRYLDNIFIERLWRSLKQEAVDLRELQDGFQAKRIIHNWIEFYNVERPHTALDKRTPDNAYFDPIQMNQAA
jgi:transposase InsO family protein